MSASHFYVHIYFHVYAHINKLVHASYIHPIIIWSIKRKFNIFYDIYLFYHNSDIYHSIYKKC